jgi:peptide chain release factor subunit 1
VDLPKKHGRGGQSALRFARLRLEKRHNYIRKVAEVATQIFISNDKPNVAGLVLAGSAEFKSKLHTSDLFDQRLNAVVVKVVDVSYGGENGFNQAIELASDTLKGVKLVREKKLLARYFSEISQDSRKFCFGVKDTLMALEGGAVADLIVWENLSINRYMMRTPGTQDTQVKFLNEKQEGASSNFSDASGVEMDVIEKKPLLEWLSENYKQFGAKLHFVTDRSQEGSQFCKGFGGIGALLRYEMDFSQYEEPADDDDDVDGEFI